MTIPRTPQATLVALRSIKRSLRGGVMYSSAFPWLKELAAHDLILGTKRGKGPTCWSITPKGEQLLADNPENP